MLRRLLQFPTGSGTGGLHRGHAVLGAGVVAAALWAYGVTHPLSGGAPTGQSTVRVWSVPPRTVTALEYHAPGTAQRMEATWDDHAEPYLWVTVVAAPPAAKADAKPGAKLDATNKEAPKAPPAPPVPLAFKGNAAAARLLDRLSNLDALRDLGRLDAQNAVTFGLTAPEARLEMQRHQGPPLRLELGRTTFGDAGRYAHNPADGHVYLLRTADLRPFTGAPGALMDRELLGLRTKDAERIVLAQGDFERTFHRLPTPGAWGISPDAGEGVAEMGALAVLLDGLKMARYAPEEANSRTIKPGPPALLVRLYREGESEPAVQLELFEPQTRSGRGRSSYTRKLVELDAALVRQLLEKARGLMQRT